MNKIQELKNKIDAKGAELDSLFATDNPTAETLASAKQIEFELETMTADLEAAKSFEAMRQARASSPAATFELPEAKSVQNEFKTIGQSIVEAGFYGKSLSTKTADLDIDFKTLLRWDPLESTCRHASLSIL